LEAYFDKVCDFYLKETKEIRNLEKKNRDVLHEKGNSFFLFREKNMNE